MNWGVDVTNVEKNLYYPLTYDVCNGLSNQWLGHAAHISEAIVAGRNVLIPDVYIVNGVQSEKDGNVMKNVFLDKGKMNSIPLSEVVDTEKLIGFIEQHGVYAQLEPFDKVIARNEEGRGSENGRKCNWMAALKNTKHSLVLEVLQAIQPSAGFSDLIQTLTDNLRARVEKEFERSANGILSNGICLHHRDGSDWHEHCSQWEHRDEVWRNYYIYDRKLPVVDLVAQRNPKICRYIILEIMILLILCFKNLRIKIQICYFERNMDCCLMKKLPTDWDL